MDRVAAIVKDVVGHWELGDGTESLLQSAPIVNRRTTGELPAPCFRPDIRPYLPGSPDGFFLRVSLVAADWESQ